MLSPLCRSLRFVRFLTMKLRKETVQIEKRGARENIAASCHGETVLCRVVLYIAFMATLQVLVDARTCWLFVLLFLCVFSFSPSCGLLIRLRSCGQFALGVSLSWFNHCVLIPSYLCFLAFSSGEQGRQNEVLKIGRFRGPRPE